MNIQDGTKAFIACPDTGQGIIWMTNGENGRRQGREVMHALLKAFEW